jgi:hypothetical protein
MADNLNGDKVIVNVELKDDAKDVFLKLKKKLNMESSSDVVRYALTFTEKRTK